MKMRMVKVYGIFAGISLLICSMLWHWQMANNYFICKHNGIIVDFLPPFIHPGRDGDFFAQPASVIYAIWAVYVAAGLFVPGIGLWIAARVYERDLKKSWM